MLLDTHIWLRWLSPLDAPLPAGLVKLAGFQAYDYNEEAAKLLPKEPDASCG